MASELRVDTISEKTSSNGVVIDLVTLKDGIVNASGINLGSAALVESELEILDGANITTTELNIIDGDTAATATTVVDADRVVFNDNGTMKQVAVTDLSAYFDDEITAMPNLITTAATTVGALNSGSITSGFGTINTGSSTITTTGLISGGSLDIDNVLINGTTIGHTDDTDLITVADGLLTIAGEVSMTTLDIGGTNVTSTAVELNLVDGITAGTVIASKAIITDSNKDITGGRNITISGELDAATGDFSGAVDIAGATTLAATTISGPTIATRPSVVNLADDGSIPITATSANIDANGTDRTGIRFAGAGTAGQILVVNNTGGEKLTFHNTEGTALLRGINADHDTMEANFVGLFISDGSLWNLIAGGADTQPDVGLTAN